MFTWRGRGSGQCGRPHRELKHLCDLHVKIEIFYEKTKKGYQKFWKYRKFAGQIPQIRKIPKKRGHFFGRPQGGGGPAHVDACGQREGVKNPIFVWTS